MSLREAHLRIITEGVNPKKKEKTCVYISIKYWLNERD